MGQRPPRKLHREATPPTGTWTKQEPDLQESKKLSAGVVMKNTAEAVILPLKGGISSLNEVYQALIEADVDPITGKCSNYDYIRQQIVQAHQLLEQSEQAASSGLRSLDQNLERLVQDEGKHEREMNELKQTLDNLRTEQESNESLLRESQGALDLARTHLDSAKQTLQDQEKRKRDAEIVTGVGAGLLAIPVIGWIAGSAMMIGGAVELDQANKAVQVAQDEVRKSENEMRKYERKVSDYRSKISQTERELSQKDDEMKQTHEVMQIVKKLKDSVAKFQEKVRSAVNLLGVLSGRISVAEHQTRRFILQEPVLKVMEDVMKAIEQITGNELLYSNDLPRLISQMKENNRQLAAICAASDAPNPSPSQKVRSSDGSWGGARNVERPVGGARSRARHSGGEREAKARRVGGSEDQGEASGGNEDQGEASGGSEKPERDKWGEQRTRRQGQRVRRDVHNRAEAPNDVHSRAAEPSDVHSRAAGPSDVHRRAAAPSDVHRRALAPSDVHRRTTAPWRRCPSRWGLELPKGREGGSKVQLILSSADNRWGSAPMEATSWGNAPHRNMGGARVRATQNNKKKIKVQGPGRNSPLPASIGATPPTEATSWGDAPHRNLSRERAGNKNSKLRSLAGTLSLDKNGGTPLTEATS
ncbi:hypothetical protein QTP86_015268 [Hemibagrus guttatus]|nr:hypothetical protein QTP86_015268 [Hemibagrus guttatus]